jgi:hypothetical protein
MIQGDLLRRRQRIGEGAVEVTGVVRLHVLLDDGRGISCLHRSTFGPHAPAPPHDRRAGDGL